MGNCLKIQSSSSWDTDDDDGRENEYGNDRKMVSRQTGYRRSMVRRRSEKMEEIEDGGITGERAMHREVKISTTKKHLEELLSAVGMEGLSVEEFLDKVMSLGIGESQERCRHWQPALQSIPEEEEGEDGE